MSKLETVPTLFTVAEVGAILTSSRASVYRKIQSGELEAVRLGGETGPLRVSSDSLQRYLRPVLPRERERVEVG